MSDNQEKKLFLLDAYALIFRSYYAFIKNPRITSKGLNTSAIFGFLLTLEEVLPRVLHSAMKYSGNIRLTATKHLKISERQFLILKDL